MERQPLKSTFKPISRFPCLSKFLLTNKVPLSIVATSIVDISTTWLLSGFRPNNTQMIEFKIYETLKALCFFLADSDRLFLSDTT